MDTLTTVGVLKDGERSSTVDAIFQAISKNLFNDIGNWVKDFAEFIQHNKHLDAFILLNKNIGIIQLLKNDCCKKLAKQLLLLNKQVLSKEQRKDYYLYRIGVWSKQNDCGAIEEQIDNFLNEFGNEIKPEIKQSIIVAKANAASQNTKINLASKLYLSVTEDPRSSADNKAWAYRGLSLISTNKEDKILYGRQGLDKWMEIGNKK